ncbi:MAG: hypothetical protein IIY23_01610 [Erysipelotrichaceae bacterium]|nr:hypothetical protein [Erysipelotrichaceae bacterium]
MPANKLRNCDEAINCMKHSLRVYIRSQEFFVYAKGKVIGYRSGSRFTLELEDFRKLYENEEFYLLEEEGAGIDLSKDEDYYRFYHK